MAVEVVAVGGVHVRAHPQAGVGDARSRAGAAHPAIRSSAGEACAGSSSCSTPSGGGSSPRRAAPSHGSTSAWSWLPATTTSSRPGERPPEILEERPRGSHRLAQRPVAQLEHVSEQHHAVDVCERPPAAVRAARRGAAGRRPRRLPRCRSETISVRIATRVAQRWLGPRAPATAPRRPRRQEAPATPSGRGRSRRPPRVSAWGA